jgi:hypothetical protein
MRGGKAVWYDLPELQQAVGVRNVVSSIRRTPCKCSDEMQNVAIVLTLCCSFCSQLTPSIS